MRASEKERLLTIRMVQAAIKQREVDERVVLDDAQVIAVLEKMVKQRRESIVAFEQGGRADLAEKEKSRDRAAAGLPADAALGRRGRRPHQGSHRHHRRHVHEGHGQGDGCREGEGCGARRHGRGERQHQGRSQRLTGFAPGAVRPDPALRFSPHQSCRAIRRRPGRVQGWVSGAVSTREEDMLVQTAPETHLLAPRLSDWIERDWGLSANRGRSPALNPRTAHVAGQVAGSGCLLPAGEAWRSAAFGCGIANRCRDGEAGSGAAACAVRGR